MTRTDKKHTAISKLILTAAATGIGISAVPYAQADDSAATTVRKLIIKNPITDETQPVPNPDNPDDVYDVFIGYDGDGTLITNIAPGQVGPGSTDAVSGSSLYSYLKNEFFSSILTEKLDESKSDVNIEYSNNQLTLTLSENGKKKINNMSSSERISSIEQKVDKLDKSMNGGIAKAGAIALLPQPTYAGHSMVSASTAHYNGEQALAIGYSSLSDNGKVILKAGASFNFSGNNTKKPLFGAAVGYQW
ncbi:YadA C-terminal domain-containing protein [Neisseria polysaccharea]|uniref:YadA C-terminal domain-containing protein n=1 Tax=Neisseria polysaccharea TaxID=489 RepID=UPI00272A90C7|nr:YadA C-terminal domain-containing protein [Neisseria polysaccharea]